MPFEPCDPGNYPQMALMQQEHLGQRNEKHQDKYSVCQGFNQVEGIRFFMRFLGLAFCIYHLQFLVV
jgi:hypothetical protein